MNKNFWLGMLLSKLCVAVGPMLATCGITVDQSVFVPQATGAILFLVGIAGSIFSHKAALDAPSPSAPVAPAVKRSPLLSAVLLAALGGLVITAPLTGCSTAQQEEFITTAENLGSNSVAYAETVANMIQTLSAAATKDAPTIEALAQTWGLLPSNSSQLATFNKIVTDVGVAGASASTLNTLLTSISSTGSVPVVTAAPSK